MPVVNRTAVVDSARVAPTTPYLTLSLALISAPPSSGASAPFVQVRSTQTDRVGGPESARLPPGPTSVLTRSCRTPPQARGPVKPLWQDSAIVDYRQASGTMRRASSASRSRVPGA